MRRNLVEWILEESLRRSHGGGIFEKESWREYLRRNHGGGVIEEESLRRNHLERIMEAESLRRDHGGGRNLGRVIMGASGRHLEATERYLGGIWELSTVGFPPSLSKENRELNIEYY